jgi:hypothetical protein
VYKTLSAILLAREPCLFTLLGVIVSLLATNSERFRVLLEIYIDFDIHSGLPDRPAIDEFAKHGIADEEAIAFVKSLPLDRPSDFEIIRIRLGLGIWDATFSWPRDTIGPIKTMSKVCTSGLQDFPAQAVLVTSEAKVYPMVCYHYSGSPNEYYAR